MVHNFFLRSRIKTLQIDQVSLSFYTQNIAWWILFWFYKEFFYSVDRAGHEKLFWRLRRLSTYMDFATRHYVLEVIKCMVRQEAPSYVYTEFHWISIWNQFVATLTLHFNLWPNFTLLRCTCWPSLPPLRVDWCSDFRLPVPNMSALHCTSSAQCSSSFVWYCAWH